MRAGTSLDQSQTLQRTHRSAARVKQESVEPTHRAGAHSGNRQSLLGCIAQNAVPAVSTPQIDHGFGIAAADIDHVEHVEPIFECLRVQRHRQMDMPGC